ncbi:hypothetical protein CEQ90_10525 [Lewinellaceae bacterium SD302]|nr:hypothetical protein CEQ90_10525 [Lewinellaceae bacterium SD302]
MLRPLLLISTLLFAVFNLVVAQTPKEDLLPCAHTGKSDWLDAYQRGEIAAVRSTDTIVVPLRIHIVGNNLGGSFLEVGRILDNLKQVNDDFAASNIVFHVDGDINYIADSEFDNHDFGVGIAKMLEYNAPNVVNNYFVTTAAGACGYYTGQGDAVAMADACVGATDRTWSHELGHFFTLPHTFFGWEFGDDPVTPINDPAPSTIFGREVERTDGSNCDGIAGDGFCDTPPDYLSFRWSCQDDNTYVYPLLDPDGVTFEVQGWPIMSYASDDCMVGFSDEQTTAVRTNIFSRGNLESGLPPEYEAAVGEQMALVYPEDSALIQIQESEGLTLEWTEVDNADFYIVNFSGNEFFAGAQNYIVYGQNSLNIPASDPYIQAPQRYYWRVRPVNRFNTLGEFTPVNLILLGEIISSTSEERLLAERVTVYPNPVEAGLNSLRLTASGIYGNEQLNVELIDLAGRRVFQQSELSIRNGKLDYELPALNLMQGVYFLRLVQGGRLATKRIVIR